MYLHNNTKETECQEIAELNPIEVAEPQKGDVLSDKTKKGKERPWKENKVSSMYLSSIFREIDGKVTNRVVRVGECGEYLDFDFKRDKTKKLSSANFCRERLCPMCQWRRSLKVRSHVTKVVNYLDEQSNGGYAYLFLSLTVRNCSPDKLKDTLDMMMKGFHRFIQYKAIKKAYIGYFRSLEVKHNFKFAADGTIEFEDYHPHFHCLIAVKKSYFTSRDYIKHPDIIDYWKRACKLDYEPDVDVRKVKGPLGAITAEVAKYATKGDEVLSSDWDFSVKTVRFLLDVLSGRRYVAWGGIMDKARRALNLDKDDNEGDLVRTDEEAESLAETLFTGRFVWDGGYTQYCFNRKLPPKNVQVKIDSEHDDK